MTFINIERDRKDIVSAIQRVENTFCTLKDCDSCGKLTGVPKNENGDCAFTELSKALDALNEFEESYFLSVK